MNFTSQVPTCFGGTSLLDYLARRFTYRSKKEWHACIAEHRILVENNPAIPQLLLRGGEEVTFIPPPFKEPPADCHYSVLYEDAAVLVINKPAPLLMHRRGKAVTRNLGYLVREKYSTGGEIAPAPINRLDRDTSGVVVWARTRSALSDLNRQMRKKSISKVYLAIVYGMPSRKQWHEEQALAAMPGSLPSAFRIDPSGKPASTRFELVDAAGATWGLVRALPLTGRTHQIRVHLQAAGLHLLGDPVYGDPHQNTIFWDLLNEKASPQNLHRQALHCCRMEFLHPETRKPLRCEAPWPLPLESVWKKLQTRAQEM